MFPDGLRLGLAPVRWAGPLRHVGWQRGRFILFDGESDLVFLVQDERTLRGKAETALWTNSEDCMKAHLEIFEQG